MFSAAEIANRALERESWARETLAGHAGRTLCVDFGPARQSFAIDSEGRLHHSEAAPDLRLTLSPLRLPALLAHPGLWGGLVVAEGDAALAATLSELALTLPWFVEELFARTFGPVMGQSLADIGRRMLALPAYAVKRFGRSVASYVGEEAQLAVGVAEARIVGSEIAGLAARVDALALRIDNLGNMAAGDGPDPSSPRRATRTRRSPT